MSSLVGFDRLKSQKEFSKVYNKGQRKHSNSIITFFLDTDKKSIGFTASKKVGNAVARNKAKRRLRALFLSHCEELKIGTYIFVAKNGIDKEEFDIVKKDFIYTLRKLNLIEKK